LLPRDEMRGVVVEDVSEGECARVLAFGASVFVSDEWMIKLSVNRKPLDLTRALLEAGSSTSGVLDYRQIGLYNAQGGLNLICPHRGELFGGMRSGELAAARSEVVGVLVKSLVDAFQDVHRGYHLREMLNEAHGSFERDWCLEGGNWSLRDDYSEYYSRHAEFFPVEQDHPYLIGATAPETAMNSALWCMFQFTPPTLEFSNRQKQVFQQALHGDSNRMIAERLRISEETVLNSFCAGYEKVEDHTVLRRELEDGRKRQRFLELIRGQMEEVRPWRPMPALKRRDKPIFAGRIPRCRVSRL
jgi:hypothetical protein